MAIRLSLKTEPADPICYGELDSPIGPLLLAATPKGICSVHFGRFREQEAELRRWSQQHLPGSPWVPQPEAVAHAAKQLDEYFAGRRTAFDLELDLHGTPFQLKVWNALRRIPYGTTASYKQIGQMIGSEKAARAIGGANNRNPVSIIVPCHRVIGADGSLVGYGGGLNIKQFLLKRENAI
jgi:O-6-methylguanine DNA methyltransferase